MSEFETRIGTGIDIHNFVPHDEGKPPHLRGVTLGGIKIPYERKLQGHSDADAVLHALVDAILGAIGEDDIGKHFENDDPAWAGANSARFLLHAYQLLKSRGGDIVNIDITIICQAPKISPHREEMRNHIANLLKLKPTRVNVKATTTEWLGFLGRGEGLAAQAAVSIRMPSID